jgi:hypothetical protein
VTFWEWKAIHFMLGLAGLLLAIVAGIIWRRWRACRI